MKGSCGKAASLVVDVGGTNTRLALAKDGILPGSAQKFDNRDFSGLEAVIEVFLAGSGCLRPASTCIAVAGPVSNGRGRLTNLDWIIDAASLKSILQDAEIVVTNDLLAVGQALHLLRPHEVRDMVTGGERHRSATRLVINAGTGFNAAAVHMRAGRPFVTPSECGHAKLAPFIAECAFIDSLRAQLDFVSIEDVLSGRGARAAKEWFGDEAPDSGYLRLMAETFGTVAGDLALIHLPFGGIYLTGGVARALAPDLLAHGFYEAFTAKGRFSEFMRRFPISLITEDLVALKGCAALIGEC
ncbi:MAG: glucokinase [Rhodobacteraceae bacterium]|nr:glucokinase [Paracoccaceae bacterium]